MESSCEFDVSLITDGKPDQKVPALIGGESQEFDDLEAAVKEGRLDSTEGVELMDHLAWIARQLATHALNQALDQVGPCGETDEAQVYLDKGDALRDSGALKDAGKKYKDALAKAESLLS
jgi:hypothetical protein